MCCHCIPHVCVLLEGSLEPRSCAARLGTAAIYLFSIPWMAILVCASPVLARTSLLCPGIRPTVADSFLISHCLT